jgi:2-C-methyl-D-erythritol 4-phosphate cytidylyltransferase
MSCASQYVLHMANITFRSDEATDQALAELTADGSDRSTAIRRALAAEAKRRRQDHLLHEANRLASDPDYLAEVAAVQDDMSDIRAW